MRAAALSLLAASTLALTPHTPVCGCWRPEGTTERMQIEAAMADESAIFAGRVVKVEHEMIAADESRRQGVIGGGPWQQGLTTVEFRVLRAWRGVDSETFRIVTDTATDCGYEFRNHARYLVYATAGESRPPSVDLCSRTRPLEDAGHDVEILGPPSYEPTTPPFRLTGPAFLAVRTRRVERASAWYAETFGLREVKRAQAEDGRYDIRILAGNELTVELIQERDVPDPPVPHLGLFKVGLYVADLGAFRSYLEELEVAVDAETFVDEALQARSLVFRDPEGNRIQAFERCDGACR